MRSIRKIVLYMTGFDIYIYILHWSEILGYELSK